MTLFKKEGTDPSQKPVLSKWGCSETLIVLLHLTSVGAYSKISLESFSLRLLPQNPHVCSHSEKKGEITQCVCNTHITLPEWNLSSFPTGASLAAAPLGLPSRESLTHQTALSFSQYQIPQPYSSTIIHTQIISLHLFMSHSIKPSL